MKERMYYILLLLAILLIAGLSLANMQSVTVSFILCLTWSYHYYPHQHAEEFFSQK